MSLKNKVIIPLILILTFFSYLDTQAQSAFGAEEPKSYIVAGITVEGNVFADEQTIRALLGFQPGDRINLAGDTKIQQAIKNLWQRKQFSDVRIDIDRITAAGMFLTVKVKEFPRINEIVVKGNKEINKDEIIKRIDKMGGSIISPYDLYLIEQDIKRLYKEEEGFQFTKVETELVPTAKQLFHDLVINIEEGVEFVVKNIDIQGNVQLPDSKIIGAMENTKTKSWWQVWRSAKFKKDEYEEDLKKVRQYMLSQGFIDARVIKDTVIFDEKKKTVDIVINVEEGNKVYVRNIDFRGNTVFQEEALLRRLELKKGDAYNVELFERNLRGNEKQTDAASLYYNTGYLTSSFETEIQRVAPDTVDIVINVFENDRFRIRRIDIVGNIKTKDKVIRRELYTQPGDYFDRSAIIRSIRGLGVLNYFNPESLQPQIVPVDNTNVDIVYKVEERSTDTFNASIGYAGGWGFTISAGFTFNNFNILEPLKGGGGQIFNFNYEFGEARKYNTFTIGFTEPWLFNTPTTLGVNLFDQRVQYPTFDFVKTGGAVNIGRRFRWPDDYFRGDWSVRYQQNRVNLDEFATSGNDLSFYYKPGVTQEASVSQRISRISLDNMFFATSGSRFSLLNEWAMGAIGVGNIDYLKTGLDMEFYNPLWKYEGMNRLVLYLGANLGYITGISSDTSINPTELYYMGGNGLSIFGVTPLRGYTDRAVGPYTGGKVMAKYTAELRFAVSLNPMPIYVFGFAEAGNVWANLAETNPFDLKRSVGVGVKMLLNPIGIIGFSYGYGFDPARGTVGDSGWRFLFHLGQ